MSHKFECSEEVSKKIDEASAVDVVNMDFSQALDNVLYGMPVRIIRSCMIQGEQANCFEGRRQKAVFQTGDLVTSCMP